MIHQNIHYGTYYYCNNGYGHAIFTNSYERTLNFFLKEPLFIFNEQDELVSKLQWFEHDDDYYYVKYHPEYDGICDIYIHLDDSSSLGKRRSDDVSLTFKKKPKYQ
jgi:hypothetical protein